MDITRLKPGEDSRKNWRTINQVLDRVDPLESAKTDSAAGIAEMRRRPKDLAGPIRMYQLMSEEDDWIVCRALSINVDGERTVGTTDFYIAKPAELRHSVVEEVIEGETFSYAYTNEHERVATIEDGDDAGLTETQVVNPYYLPADDDNDGSIIYAHETAGTGVWREVSTDVFEELTLLEISGREWAQKSE